MDGHKRNFANWSCICKNATDEEKSLQITLNLVSHKNRSYVTAKIITIAAGFISVAMKIGRS